MNTSGLDEEKQPGPFALYALRKKASWSVALQRTPVELTCKRSKQGALCDSVPISSLQYFLRLDTGGHIYYASA